MTTKQNDPVHRVNSGQGQTAKSFSSHFPTTGVETLDIETRIEGAVDAGLVNDDGRHVDDQHFGWAEPPEGFEFSDDAVTAILQNRMGESYSQRIAGPLWVSAQKAGGNGDLFIEISFIDMDGKARRVDMPRGDLSRPDDVVKSLLREGASVDPTQARHIARYLANSNPVTRLEKDETSKPKVETVKTLCFADVAAEKIAWLWFGKIALGKLTLLVGDPGLGKSLVTLYMAARTSLGGLWPDGSLCPLGNTIFISCEDDPADTIRPRLDAAGADVGKIHLLTAVCNANGKDRTFTLDNVSALEEAIVRIGDVKLIVVDPISAYMGGADSHNNADVRSVLAPLSELAAKHKIAIVVVSHLNKGSGPAMYRSMGSLAFTAAARAVWAVVKDKGDTDRRLVLPIKNNIAADTAGLAYKIVPAGGGSPCLEWEPGPVNVDVSEAMTPVMTNGGGESNERNGPKDWLIDVLNDGPMSVKEIKRVASDAGFSWRTIERAKSDAVVEAVKGDFKGGWVWRISQDRQETAKTATQKEWRPSDNLAVFDKTDPAKRRDKIIDLRLSDDGVFVEGRV